MKKLNDLIIKEEIDMIRELFQKNFKFQMPTAMLYAGCSNNYQKASKLLFTFIANKQFGQLITIAPHSLTMLNTTNIEFSFIEVWFTDQNSKPLKKEDNDNMTLIIGRIL